MGIRVVTSARPTRKGNLWRAVRALLGWLLTLGGMLVAVPMAGLFVATFALNISNKDLGTVFLLLSGGLAAIFIGRRLIRGKRRLILFLRRFGFAGSSRALSFAVGTAVGRRFRAVTLDDAEVAPVGTGRWARWLLAAASLASVYLLIVIVGELVAWLTGDALGEVFKSIFEGSLTAAIQRGENAVGAFISSLFVAMFMTMFVGALFLAFLGLCFTMIGSSAALSASSWVGVMRAEFAKRTTVQRSDEVDRAAIKVAKKARGIFAPRLVVLRSASSVWRETVSRLADVADILLIDVSVPSDNLLWEISVLKAEHHARWILISQSDRIAELVNCAGTSTGSTGTKLAALLDAEEVLTYDTASPKALRQFTRALRDMCEDIAGRTA